MESEPDRASLVVIVGETASGKSALALRLARRFNGEIIAADSRTVYKGMDIGTAKPTPEEQSKVPYHLLDVTTPDQPITAADFKLQANEAIRDIAARGRVPFLVGGTGLYIDAVLYDFSFAQKGSEAERQKWRRMSVDELQAELLERDIHLPPNAKNPRHLIRQLETGGAEKQRQTLRSRTLILGVSVDRAMLERRIEQRIEHMFVHGLQDEVKQLARHYAWNLPSMQTIGYQEFSAYASEQQNLGVVKQEIKKHTLQYAKRQRTWFRRNKSIHWITGEEEAVDLITTFLNK